MHAVYRIVEHAGALRYRDEGVRRAKNPKDEGEVDYVAMLSYVFRACHDSEFLAYPDRGLSLVREGVYRPLASSSLELTLVLSSVVPSLECPSSSESKSTSSSISLLFSDAPFPDILLPTGLLTFRLRPGALMKSVNEVTDEPLGCCPLGVVVPDGRMFEAEGRGIW